MLKKLLKHGILFVFAKSLVMISPLYAAHILNKANYGLVEFSISVAMVISTVLSLGAGNTIAFEKIKNDNSSLIFLGQTYSLYIGLFLAGLSVFTLFMIDNETIGLVLGISSFFVIQYAVSAYTKASGLGARASVIDSGVYIILFLLVSISWIQGSKHLLYISGFLLASLFLAMILNKTRNTSSTIDLDNVKRFFARGIPIMFSGLFAVLFFNLPKIVLAHDSMSIVGDFSLYFRWAAIALVFYQFVAVVFFRDIYSKSPKVFDKFVALIGFIVFLIGCLILIILFFLDKYDIIFIPIPQFDMHIQLIFIAIISIWTISASLEGLLYREQLTSKQIVANVLGGFVFSLLYFIWARDGDILFRTVLSWFVAFFIIVLYQLFTIHRYKKQKFIFISFVFSCINIITVGALYA